MAVVIALLITTKDKHTAEYVFTSVNNQSGWSSDGTAFLLGLLSVQWTCTDYDATCHISEEVKRASFAAPVAVFIAVIGTCSLGWVYNIVSLLRYPWVVTYDYWINADLSHALRSTSFALETLPTSLDPADTPLPPSSTTTLVRLDSSFSGLPSASLPLPSSQLPVRSLSSPPSSPTQD
jgi:amino acid transporter